MSSGFSFGLPSSSSNTSGFSFGGTTGGGGGGGLNLGLKPLGTTTTNPTTTSNPSGGLSLGLGGSTGTGFNLGGGSTTGSTTSASTTGGLGLNLGGTSTNTSGGTGLGLGLGLGGSTATTSAPAAANTSISTAPSTFGALSSSSTSSAQNPITFKVLEDYINKWMSDLDSQEKDFLNQATQLNALDKLMVENGDKIIDLSNEVTRLTNDQDQLGQELDFIHSQQNDLEQAIKKLEQGIEQMPLIIPQSQQTSPYMQSVMMSGDTSRIEMYRLLIEVDNQLKSTSCDVRDIIRRLNDTNVNLNDPIVQISKILNSHMDSLNWIEENSVMLQAQVDKVAKLIDDRYREPDSSTSRFMFLRD